MENLLPNYPAWRRKYAKSAIIMYFIIIILEFVIFFLLKSNNMILESTEEYVRRYFFEPITWNTVIGIGAVITSVAVKNQRIKNAVPVITLTCMFGVVAIVHNVFFVTLLIFCVPIFMTIVFGDKRMLLAVLIISTLFVAGVVWYCYTKTYAARENPYFLPSVLIAIVAIWACAGIANTLIDLLNTQNERLIKAVEVANQANESKSAFLSNMSHEIRTPMNAIVGITDIMLRTKRSTEDEKYLLNIKHSGAALLVIINDILDFSKIESGKMELVDDTYSLNGMLDDLWLIFKNRIGDKNVELIYDIDENIPHRLYGDEIRVRQILINLVNNAVKFTDVGFVKLSVKLDRSEQKEAWISFAVSDSGQGIKEEDLPKLFASFEQINTKRNHKKEGTGLGLAISKQLISMMGGEIAVESKYGVGTTFSFTIRQTIDDSLVDEEVNDSNDEDLNLSGAKILLVEDNELNTEVALMLFEPFEMEIDTAENGEVAVEMVKNKHYDLVFMDHMMPVMDGVEATQAIRALDGEYYQKLPIIALTANAVSEAKDTLISAGMNDITTKPIEMEHVTEILRRWVKKNI